MKLNSISSILAVSSFFCFSACTRNSDTVPNHDESFQVLGKISSQALESGRTTLSLAPDGTFELLYDADVRYFSEHADVPKGHAESDARCLVKIRGTATFNDQKERYVVPTRVVADLVVNSVEPILSDILRNDELSVAPEETCRDYSAAIMKTKEFTFAIFDFDANFISFVQLGFDIQSGSSPSSAWLFNSEMHSAIDNAKSSIVRKNFRYNYLVKPGTTVDLTELVLKDLDGKVLETRESRPTRLSISAPQSRFLLYSSFCRFAFGISVKSILLEDSALKVNLTVQNSKNIEADAEADQGCADDIAAIRQLSSGPMTMTYSTSEDEQTYPSAVSLGVGDLHSKALPLTFTTIEAK
jgi:hypothetical protein